MSDYVIASPIIGAPMPVSVTATVQQAPLGFEAWAVDRGSSTFPNLTGTTAFNTAAGTAKAGLFVYCRGSNVTQAGLLVNIQNNSAVVQASGNSSRALPIGIAAGPLSATNVFGWVQVRGIADYVQGSNVSYAADIPLYMGATSGYVGSTYAAGLHIFGMVAPVSLASSLSAGSLTFMLNRPFQPGMAIASSN